MHQTDLPPPHFSTPAFTLPASLHLSHLHTFPTLSLPRAPPTPPPSPTTCGASFGSRSAR